MGFRVLFYSIQGSKVLQILHILLAYGYKTKIEMDPTFFDPFIPQYSYIFPTKKGSSTPFRWQV